MSKKETSDIALSLRVPERVYTRAKRACYRDELVFNRFVRECIEEGTTKLLDKQEKHGFKLQEVI
jgi:predicted HicB family RNase H-like nuclease